MLYYMSNLVSDCVPLSNRISHLFLCNVEDALSLNLISGFWSNWMCGNLVAIPLLF